MSKTRLQLAQRLRQEARIAGTGPTTTIGQTGELKKLVDWLDDAYADIQQEYETWNFLRTAFTASITSGTATYTPAAAGVTNHAHWITDDVRCYLTATGVSDEQEIFYMEWEEFKRTYLFGSMSTQSGRPTMFSIKADNSITFWPVPDDTYTVTGEYYRTPYEMTLNAHTPAFPARFHMIVMWRALMLYAADYGEWDKYEHAQNEYRDIMGKLEFDQLPRIGWGEPLA